MERYETYLEQVEKLDFQRIDQTTLETNSQNKLLFNICKELHELNQVLRETPEKEEKVMCDRCGAEFESKKQLQGHKIRCKG